MRINPQLMEKIKESLSSVLPITAIVLLLCVSIAPLTPGAMVLFLFGALLLILGTGVFTLGVDMSMTPMGQGMGVSLSRSGNPVVPAAAAFAMGALITMAEPDLQVLAEQIPAVPNMTLILTVAVGVGIFLVAALLRVGKGRDMVAADQGGHAGHFHYPAALRGPARGGDQRRDSRE